MANYIIVCDEVTGVNGLRHLKGSKVDDSKLISGAIDNLLLTGAIRLDAEKTTKKKEETKE